MLKNNTECEISLFELFYLDTSASCPANRQIRSVFKIIAQHGKQHRSIIKMPKTVHFKIDI